MDGPSFRPVTEAVCDALGGARLVKLAIVPHGPSPARAGVCHESLGSKLVFDAILDVWTAAKTEWMERP